MTRPHIDAGRRARTRLARAAVSVSMIGMVATGSVLTAVPADAADEVIEEAKPTPYTTTWNDESQWAARAATQNGKEGVAIDRELLKDAPDYARLERDTGLSRAHLVDMRNALTQMAKVSFSVSQTTNLTDQTVDVSWQGATPSDTGEKNPNMFQIMQCWSKDRNTQPERTQCAFGGSSRLETPYGVYSRMVSTVFLGERPYVDPVTGNTATQRSVKVLDPREKGIFASAGDLIPVRLSNAEQLDIKSGILGGPVPAPPTWRDDEQIALFNTYLQCPGGAATYRLTMTHLATGGEFPVVVSRGGRTLNSIASPDIPIRFSVDKLFQGAYVTASTEAFSLQETRRANGLTSWPTGEYRVVVDCNTPTNVPSRSWNWQGYLNWDGGVWRRGVDGVDLNNGLTIPFDPVGDGEGRGPTNPFATGIVPRDGSNVRLAQAEHFTFFNRLNRNEIARADNGVTGARSYSMTVQSARTASHLGCGTAAAACWLVIVPRTGVDVDGTSQSPPLTGPLSQTNWDRRVVVPLGFAPIDVGCRAQGDVAQVNAVPVVENAVGSWQAATCGETPTRVAPVVDGAARGLAGQGDSLTLSVGPPQSTGETATAAPTALTGLSVAFRIDRQEPTLQADRQTNPGAYTADKNQTPLETLNLTPLLLAKLLTQSYGDGAFPNQVAERDAQGNIVRENGTIRYGFRQFDWTRCRLDMNPGATCSTTLNTIPNSPYLLFQGVSGDPKPPASYLYYGNAPTLFTDPEFLLHNPGLERMAINLNLTGGGDGLRPELPGSPLVTILQTDAYGLLWDYILSDDRARAFLAGDEVEGVDVSTLTKPQGDALRPFLQFNTMRVNPYYRGAIAEGADSIGRLDQTTGVSSVARDRGAQYQAQLRAAREAELKQQGASSQEIAAELERITYSWPLATTTASQPLLDSDRRVALNMATGLSGRRDGEVGLENSSAEFFGYRAIPAAEPGSVVMLGITTTAYARQFGLRSANLQNADGTFVGPTATALRAAREQMTVQADGAVLTDSGAIGGNGYPLAMIVNASTDPAANDVGKNRQFADFLEFAATSGQEPGLEFGQLPPGYAPLPAADVSSLRAMAQRLRAYSPPVADTPAPTAPAPAAPSASVPAVPAPRPGSGPGPGTGTGTGTGNASVPAATAPPVPAEPSAGPTGGVEVANATGRARTSDIPAPWRWIVPVVLGMGLAAVTGGVVLSYLGRRAGGPV